MGGGAGGEFPQGGQKAGRGLGVGERVEGHGGGELWGLRAELNLQDILLADGHEGVQLERRILLPVAARGQDDGTGLDNVPLALIPLARGQATAVSAPAMPNYLKMNAG